MKSGVHVNSVHKNLLLFNSLSIVLTIHSLEELSSSMRLKNIIIGLLVSVIALLIQRTNANLLFIVVDSSTSKPILHLFCLI